MADDFQQLLGATIHHLEDLKAHGHRFVPVGPQTLRDLSVAAPAAPLPKPTTTQMDRRTPAPAAKPSAPAARTSPRANSIPVTEDVSPLKSYSEKALENGADSRRLPALKRAAEPEQPTGRGQALAELRERAIVCTRCPNLVTSRKQVVFGVGDPNAELLFVGEAPGADEDAQGEPFVGRAGQLLTRIIETMGLSRDTVYIANILKCRPDMPSGAPGNRKPTPEEMETCIPWLLDQIGIIQPKVMVALGATAVEGLIGGTVKITQMRGQWKEFKEIPLMPTFHPSYLIRGNDISKKRLVWEDMLQVMERLGLPISAKQRGFFLKK